MYCNMIQVIFSLQMHLLKEKVIYSLLFRNATEVRDLSYLKHAVLRIIKKYFAMLTAEAMFRPIL